jgi:hypothetical protein
MKWSEKTKKIEVIFKHISNHEHNVIKTNKNIQYNIKKGALADFLLLHRHNNVHTDKKDKQKFKYTYTNI